MKLLAQSLANSFGVRVSYPQKGKRHVAKPQKASGLDAIRALPHVAFVDDERNIGNSIIVTLKDGFDFAAEPGCGVRGFDNVKEAVAGCRASQVIAKVAA